MKSIWLIVAGLAIAVTGAAAFDAATTAPQATTIVVKPGQELRITVEVVGTVTRPPTDPPPPVDPPPVDTPPTPPTDPPKPPKAPPALTVPTDGSLAACCAAIAQGGTITVKAGVHTLASPCVITAAGVTIRGEDGAAVVMSLDFAPGKFSGDLFQVRAGGCTIRDLAIRGCFRDKSRMVRGWQGMSDGLTLKGLVIENGGFHAVDIDGKDFLVENCTIRNILSGTTDNRLDAHCIVTTSGSGTIRGCKLGPCSGDSWQGEEGLWDVVIDDCDMFCKPLASDIGGYKAGDTVGENAIDTKSKGVGVCKLVVQNCRMWGFTADGALIAVRSAVNIKQVVDCTITDCHIWDSEIAFRLRCSMDGKRVKNCTIEDCEVRDCLLGFRLEDMRQGGTPFYIRRVFCDSAKHVYSVGMKTYMPFAFHGIATPGEIRDCTFVGEDLEWQNSPHEGDNPRICLALRTDGIIRDKAGQPLPDGTAVVDSKGRTWISPITNVPPNADGTIDTREVPFGNLVKPRTDSPN